MPLYEYECKDCGKRFEAMQRMSQRAEAPPCPECGSERTELAISASAFLGGGSGSGSACSTSSWTGGG